MGAPWARGTDGSTGVYPSESGMVGTLNSLNCWYTYIPPETARYEAEYMGRYIAVANLGNGQYELTVNGEKSIRRYANRWKLSTFFDALGLPIGNPQAAGAAGDPRATYFEPGELVQVTQAPIDPPATVPPVEHSTDWTRTSEGADNVWAGESGMVASLNSRGKWGAWKPRVGLVIQSHYSGSTITVRNEDNAHYSYQKDNGPASVRVYDPHWSVSVFFDASGAPISAHESASVSGDPVAAYYSLGPVYSPSAVPSTPITPAGNVVTPTSPVIVTPMPSGSVTVTPGGSVALPVVITPSDPVRPGGSSGAPAPVVVGFPEMGDPNTAPTANGVKMLAVAAAAYLLLNK